MLPTEIKIQSQMPSIMLNVYSYGKQSNVSSCKQDLLFDTTLSCEQFIASLTVFNHLYALLFIRYLRKKLMVLSMNKSKQEQERKCLHSLSDRFTDYISKIEIKSLINTLLI